MATQVPGTNTGWNIEKWQRTVEDATYQKMRFIPIIDEGDKLFEQLHIRKHQRVAASTLAQTAAGTTLTTVSPIDSEVTVDPTGRYVAIYFSQNFTSQTDLNLTAEARGNAEQALAEATDEAALTDIQSNTVILSQASVDGPLWRKAVGTLMGNTNGVAAPGDTPQMHAIFTHKQYPSLGTIPEFNSAEVRGDGENPFVKGIWMRGGGVMLHMSTVIANDANGDHNAVFIPSAYVASWNERTLLKVQEEELENRVILYNNMGTNVKHNLRAVAIRTTASDL